MNKINNAYALELLHYLTIENRDNGKMFDVEKKFRLNRIELELEGSPFKECKAEKIYYAYAQVPFEELGEEIIIVSSHVDLHKSTKEYFSIEEEEYLLGTYDNSITNAALVTLAKTKTLPKNLVVVFTGDEEGKSHGAKKFCDYINNELHKKAKCIVLDVTEEAYGEAVFSIENTFWKWKKRWGERILDWAKNQDKEWRLVYAEDDKTDLEEKKLFKTIPKNNLKEVEIIGEDETKKYKKNKIRCFSFCLPVSPETEDLHSSEGMRVYQDSYFLYIDALYDLLWVAAKPKKAFIK